MLENREGLRTLYRPILHSSESFVWQCVWYADDRLGRYKWRRATPSRHFVNIIFTYQEIRLLEDIFNYDCYVDVSFVSLADFTRI